jgi:hypothetical protein
MGVSAAFGTFVTPSASVFGRTHALLWERRDERPGATLQLVCHDEVVAECDAEQAGEAKIWLEKAVVDRMEETRIRLLLLFVSGTPNVGFGSLRVVVAANAAG